MAGTQPRVAFFGWPSVHLFEHQHHASRWCSLPRTPMPAREIKRFEARVDAALADDISALADRLDLDQSEVFRRAMSLYIRAKRDAGDRILLESPQGAQTELVGI
jgi:hypothetical protein